MFGFRSSEIFWKKPEFSNSWNFGEKVRKKVRKLFENVRKFQKFRKNDVKFEVLGQKNLFFGQKVWKSSEKSSEKFGNFGKNSEILKTGFSECSEISEIWIFRTFRKLRKNDVQLELRKLRNIRSNSETDPKVRLKVRNAGP